ncbi:unnamed protein product, partial [Rotaria sp. Silwood2]
STDFDQNETYEHTRDIIPLQCHAHLSHRHSSRLPNVYEQPYYDGQ